MQVSVDELAADLQEVKPGIKVVATNARSGEGVDEVLQALGLQGGEHARPDDGEVNR